jgi:hypothetical protein
MISQTSEASRSFSSRPKIIFNLFYINRHPGNQVLTYSTGDLSKIMKKCVIYFMRTVLFSLTLFFGVIDTGGFNTFEALETEGVIEDQEFIFADDFTIAILPKAMPWILFLLLDK